MSDVPTSPSGSAPAPEGNFFNPEVTRRGLIAGAWGAFAAFLAGSARRHGSRLERRNPRHGQDQPHHGPSGCSLGHGVISRFPLISAEREEVPVWRVGF
jgi:hypothetical protein